MTNTEFRRRANTEPLECILAQRQLRWVSHVCRMPEGSLPRQVFYGELAAGGRLMGGQKKRYNDHICATMKRWGIPPAQLEELAGHREMWRNTCFQRVEHYVEQYNAAAEDRRARRTRLGLLQLSSTTCVPSAEERVLPESDFTLTCLVTGAAGMQAQHRPQLVRGG